MGKIISNIADNYGLRNLHKLYSKEDHFKYIEDEVNLLNKDILKFYSKPNIPEIHFDEKQVDRDYSNGILKFPSEIENGSSNKDAIFHYKINSDNKNDINIILIHGWRANSLNRLGKVFLDSFTERKYNVFSFVLPYHMERSQASSLYSGELFVSADISRTLKSVKQAVSDIRALISYIKNIKKGKVIVIGLSLGGIMSNLLAEAEENIDVLISLFYGNDLSFTVFDTEAGKYIKKDFEKNNIDKNLVSKSWDIINPSKRKPIIDLNKILLVSGKHDKYVLNEDTDKLWENWGRPKRYNYNCGHSGIVLSKNKVKKDILKFIDERV